MAAWPIHGVRSRRGGGASGYGPRWCCGGGHPRHDLWSGLARGSGTKSRSPGCVARRVPLEVPAETINRVCGSGMRAITLAESLIRIGDYEVGARRRYGEHDQRAVYPAQSQNGLPDGRRRSGRHDAWRRSRCAPSPAVTWESTAATSRPKKAFAGRARRWALRSHQRAIAAQDSGFWRERLRQ